MTDKTPSPAPDDRTCGTCKHLDAVGDPCWHCDHSNNLWEPATPAPAPAVPSLPDAMTVVIRALQDDPGYAWSWHCNIAMAAVDEGVDHGTANHAAARFMRLLASVEPAHELPPKPEAQAPVAAQQKPAAWTLQSELDAKETTCRAHLWFVDPKNSAWTPLYTAPQAPRPTAPEWEGAEEWMPLAWELCAEENGEEACNELVWEGGPVPEPWGDRWLKYEDEAKRLIALVRKHAPQAPAQALAAAGGTAPEMADVPRRQPVLDPVLKSPENDAKSLIKKESGVVLVPALHNRPIQWVLEAIGRGSYGDDYQEAWQDLLTAADAGPAPGMADEQRDAARYRWIRKNSTRSTVNIEIHGNGCEIEDTLDEAVDEAMARDPDTQVTGSSNG